MTEPLKIAVVGGGPAGLLFAKLVAREHPNYRIDVFEQNPSSATYGWISWRTRATTWRSVARSRG